MPSRSKHHPRKPKPSLSPLKLRRPKNSSRVFGHSKINGEQHEFIFRRIFPISETDTARLHRFIAGVIKPRRKRFNLWFVSFEINCRGGLYELGFQTEEEQNKWKRQWISTAVAVNSLRDLKAYTNDLLDTRIPFLLRDRFAWILRIRVVMFKNSEWKARTKFNVK